MTIDATAIVSGAAAVARARTATERSFSEAVSALALEHDPAMRTRMWMLAFRLAAGMSIPLRCYCEGD